MIKVHLVDFEHKLILRALKDAPPWIFVTMSSDINKTINVANKGDIVFVYNYRLRKSIHKLVDKGCIVYPTPTMSEICSSRARTCKIIDDLTRFPMVREYYPSVPKYVIEPEGGFVYKLGDHQQGEKKYRKEDINKIHSYYESYIKEEYIEGRSIRVLWMLNKFYLIEHTNDHWIKNKGNTVETVIEYNSSFDKIIQDSKYILKKLSRCHALSPTLGFDYVVGEKTGLLEFNDMCGLPEDENIEKDFVDAILHLTNKVN